MQLRSAIASAAHLSPFYFLHVSRRYTAPRRVLVCNRALYRSDQIVQADGMEHDDHCGARGIWQPQQPVQAFGNGNWPGTADLRPEQVWKSGICDAA